MTKPSGQLIAMSFATVCLLACVGTGADRQAEAPGPASRPVASSAPVGQGEAEFPRIAMLWAPAETERAESKWDNIARHDVVVLGIQTLGLEWTPQEFHATVESVQEATVRRARRNLAGIHRRNPRAIVLCEVYFFEEHLKGYPPDHRWWLRDVEGKRVRF